MCCLYILLPIKKAPRKNLIYTHAPLLSMMNLAPKSSCRLLYNKDPKKKRTLDYFYYTT